jgi:hypothetical protein
MQMALDDSHFMTGTSSIYFSNTTRGRAEQIKYQKGQPLNNHQLLLDRIGSINLNYVISC